MKLLFEKGDIHSRNRFLSPRLVTEALEKKFTVRVVDERSDYIKLKIIRLARLYGFPFIWPQASMEVWIENENDKLTYKFFWPEYLALIIPFAIFPLIEPQIFDFIFFYIMILFFFGFLIFLDTRWVVKRIRTLFKNN